jgi:hypothetical protein
MRVGCTKGLSAAFDEIDIGNPVALPSHKARVLPFTIEACRPTTKEGLINTFERIDADNRIKMAVNAAGHDRHYAAPCADVELCGSSAKFVIGYKRGIFDQYLQSAA